MWSETSSAPVARACAAIRSISAGPCTSTSPGQFSTSVVIVSCPPGWMPSISTGASIARAP